MGIMNLNLFRKAYMLEFLENDVPREVFTFSVPPESEDFDFAQRVTETKTFGGSVFDDYGNDTIKINLSGSTVNEEKKIIYKGLTKFPKYLTGEKEIFHLQKILEEWGEIEKIPSKKVYLYDLSKMSAIQMAAIAGGGAPSRNYWRVAIKSLKIKRAKDKPRTYNYTLEMIGFNDPKSVLEPLFGGALEVLDAIQNVIDIIDAVLGYAEFAAAAIDSIAKFTTDTKQAFEKLGKADWTSPTGIIKNVSGIVDSTFRITGVSSNNNVFNTAQKLISAVNKFASLGASEETPQSSVTSQNDERSITFNTGAGSYIAPVKVAFGEKLTSPANPTLVKHTFGGWYTDNSFTTEFDFDIEISDNMTLYAKWTQSVATVTFNSRLGTAVPTHNINIGTVIAAPDPAPTRTGYVFEHWCIDIAGDNRFNFTTPITGDITLYARWRIVYAVTFTINGGSAVPVQQIEVGAKVIAPMIPTMENYLFVCWCKEAALNNEYDFNSPVNSNLTLYAKWTQVSNTITFNSNDGSAVPAQTVIIGKFVTKPETPTKTGYSFIRWCSDAALTNEFIFETTQANTPLTIYAAWSINKYSVTFITNDGSAIPVQEIEYQNKVVYPINPIKDGQLFKRWCTDVELTTEFDFSTAITASMNLYAEWVGGQA